jgi:hypothetical protein
MATQAAELRTPAAFLDIGHSDLRICRAVRIRRADLEICHVDLEIPPHRFGESATLI